jgi:hypothetical protein
MVGFLVLSEDHRTFFTLGMPLSLIAVVRVIIKVVGYAFLDESTWNGKTLRSRLNSLDASR